MQGLSALFSVFGSDLVSVAHRARRNIVICALAMLLLATAYALGIIALILVLCPVFGLPEAVLILAVATLVSGLVLLAGLSAWNRSEREKARRTAELRAAGLALAGILPALLKSRVGLAIAAAAALALIAGAETRRNK